MDLAFDIFQGIGIAAAVGVRPFLPALAVGALAAGDVQIDFAHSSYSFLESDLFLLLMVFGVVVLGLAERRFSREALSQRSSILLLAAFSIAIGALLFGGSLARDHHAAWPGLIAGAICAAIGVLATAPLLVRVRARLSAETIGVLPLFSEIAAVIAAILSVVVPPVGVIVLVLLLVLLYGGRRRGEQKYAGLRILR